MKWEIAACLELGVLRQKDDDTLWKLISSSSTLNLRWLMVLDGWCIELYPQNPEVRYENAGWFDSLS
jgi:hypothetical protein